MRGKKSPQFANVLSGPTTVSELTYTVDPVGNPTQIVRTGTLAGTETYSYDATDRVTGVCYQASCPGGSDPFIRYTYDSVGNRLTEARPSGTTIYTYNAGDEMAAAGSTTYTYDDNGNQTATGSDTYSYNAAEQLTSADVGGTTTNYSYDGDGNLTTADDGSNITKYTWDTMWDVPQLVRESTGSGSLIRRYLYGTSRIAMTEGGNTYYYLSDSLGSVTDLTDGSGNSEWAYLYEPFGSSRTEDKIDSGAPDNVMKFAGELEESTGLYYLRAREYDATVGRFLSRDPSPSCSPHSVSSEYAYAGNRSTSLVDPTGETSQAPSEAMKFERFASSPQKYGNGCGPGGTLLGVPVKKIVPDSIPFVFDFSDACASHDFCYGGHWGTVRRHCDDDFLRAMRNSCGGWSWNPLQDIKKGACLTVAELYYRLCEMASTSPSGNTQAEMTSLTYRSSVVLTEINRSAELMRRSEAVRASTKLAFIILALIGLGVVTAGCSDASPKTSSGADTVCRGGQSRPFTVKDLRTALDREHVIGLYSARASAICGNGTVAYLTNLGAASKKVGFIGCAIRKATITGTLPDSRLRVGRPKGGFSISCRTSTAECTREVESV
jgi:RHS repeat-associated protein